tara:strand:- start:3400 stop:4770 length:1371 start_codon:yes stop_codon:yes gene_type:complete
MGLPTITTSSAGAAASPTTVHNNDVSIANELGNLEKSTNISTYRSAWVLNDAFMHVPRHIEDAPEKGMGSTAAGWNQATDSPLRGIYETGPLFEIWPQDIQLTRMGAFIRAASGSHIARDIPAASASGSPTTINYTAHGLKTGDCVIISGFACSDAAESANVNVATGHKITVTSVNAFTIAVSTSTNSTSHGQFVQMRTSAWQMYAGFPTTFTLRATAYKNATSGDLVWESSALTTVQEVGKLVISGASYNPVAVAGTATTTWAYNDSSSTTAAAGQAYFKDFPSGTSGDSSDPKGTITYTAPSGGTPTRTYLQVLLQSSTTGLTAIRVRDTGSLTRIFLSNSSVIDAFVSGGVTILQVGDSILVEGFSNGDAAESGAINTNGGWRVEAIGATAISGGTYNGQTKAYIDIHDIGATLADLGAGCTIRPKHMPPIDFSYELRFEEDHFQPDTGYPSS